jgi:hypothetical protein
MSIFSLFSFSQIPSRHYVDLLLRLVQSSYVIHSFSAGLVNVTIATGLEQKDRA